jgi:predicted PurR-regulated permease PerM
MPRSTWLNILIILLVIIAASYVAQLVWGFVSGFGDIILLLLLAWLVAYALSPLVEGLNERAIFAELIHSLKLAPKHHVARRLAEFRVTRPLAVAIVYLGVLIFVVVAIASLIPTILSQVNLIVTQLSNISSLETTLTALTQNLFVRFNIPLRDTSIIENAFSSFQSLATPILQNTVAILTSVLGLLGNVLLVILFSFFFALDGPRFTAMLFSIVPERLHQETRMFLITTDRAFGGFLRAQILQAAVIGIGTVFIMGLFGIQAPLLSGVFAGLAMLIPLLGPPLSFVPPLLATLLTDPSKTLWVMIAVALLQVIVVNIMMPRIVGNALGLHPLVIIVSLLVGIKVAGFWGAFFAMPLAGIVSAFGAYLFRRRQRLAELTAAMVREDASELTPPAREASAVVEPHTEMVNPSDVVHKESRA